MVLVIGGSGSGKSSYAEETAVSLAQSSYMKKYYLATMQVFDEEGQSKVMRHRRLRSGKGFFTIEQPVNIHKATAKMALGEKTVLLECISNLTANEMFSDEKMLEKEQVVEKIIKGIRMLKKETTHLIVVSNNVFEDGIVYDKETMEYIEVMGKINQELADMAEQVVEVVVGIPICR